MDEAAAKEAAGARCGKNRLDGALVNAGLLIPTLDDEDVREAIPGGFKTLGL